FVNAWNVAYGHPPQSKVSGGKFFKPVVALPQQFCMNCAIHVVLKRFHRLPYRHVDEDAIVIVRAKISGVALGGLQAPHETRTAIGEGIDLIQPGDEASHDGIVERSLHASDVDLSNMKLRHKFLLDRLRLSHAATRVSSPLLRCQYAASDSKV